MLHILGSSTKLVIMVQEMYKKNTHPSQKNQENLEASSLFIGKNGEVVYSLLNYCLKQWRYKTHIQKSQAYLEKVVDCEQRQLRREIRWLEDKEIMRVKYGHQGEINSYYLTPEWRQPENFNKLLKFITGIVIFQMSLLVSQPDVRLIYLNDSYYIKILSVSGRSNNAHAREERSLANALANPTTLIFENKTKEQQNEYLSSRMGPRNK